MEREVQKPDNDEGERSVRDRQAPATLSRVEEEYLPLISDFLDIVYSITPDGSITYISPRIAHYGYESRELLSHSIFEFIAADSRDYVLEMLKESLAKGETTPIEFKMMGKDGRIYWMEALGKTIYDDSGQPISQVGVIRDITRRKRVEKKLRESEDKYRNIVEHVNDWVWEVDAECRYSYASPRVRDLLGYEPKELIDKTPYDFMSAEEAERIRAKFDQIFIARREFSLLENTLVRKDGTPVTVETSGMPMFDEDGRFAGYRGIDRDITGRKLAEEELKAARNMLKLIINNIPQGIFWKDRNSTYMGCNRVFSKAAGLKSPEDIVGKTDFDLPWSQEQAVTFRSYDRRIMENEIPEYHIIEQQREADGKLAWIETNKVPLHDAQGNVIGILGTYEDITERKRAEEALKQSEADLDRAQGIAALGNWEWDLKTNMLSGSREYYRIFNIEPAGPVPFEQLASRLHPDDMKWVNKAKKDIIFENLPNNYDFRILTPGGEVRYIHSEVEVIRDKSGQPSKIFGTMQDITERKRVEMALRESEEKFKTIFDRAAMGIAIADSKGYILDCNSAYLGLLGYSKEELQGKRFADITHPDDVARNLELQRQMNDGLVDNYQIEKRYVRKDGKLIWVLLTTSAIRNQDGSLKYNLAVTKDISERKQAEEALRESEAMLNSIFRSAPTGIGVVVHRVIREANEKLCQMTGYSREELLGKSARMFYPSDREYEYVGKVKYDMIAERGVGDVETCWRRKDGTLIDILLSSSPIDPDNLSAGVTFTALDITNRKRAENEVIEAKSQAELYLDLLGHDINNMHQIALGYLELARDMPASERQNEYLDKPIEVLQRSARLIKNVRKLQKLQEGVFLAQEVDVTAVLADVQREFGAVPGKAVTLNLNRCEHCHVRANGLLYDVFANLVSNAIKHTGDRADIVVDLDVVRDDTGRYCRVMVEDNGPGIPDDFKGRIFNRMLKGDSRAKGMGLGLYLVKSLVESYGGRVWVEDRITGDHTKGARFVVQLPVAD